MHCGVLFWGWDDMCFIIMNGCWISVSVEMMRQFSFHFCNCGELS